MKTKIANLLNSALLTGVLIGSLLFQSCSKHNEYPKYSLETISFVPDSLKEQHRKWITETVRAASQHMTGGDYEDVDATIRQAKYTADELYQTKIIGLKKSINENYWEDLHLTPNELTKKEKLILDSLVNNR